MGAGNGTLTGILGMMLQGSCVCVQGAQVGYCLLHHFGNGLWRACVQTPPICVFYFCSRGLDCHSSPSHGVAHLHSVPVVLADVQGVLMGCSSALGFQQRVCAWAHLQPGPVRREDVFCFPSVDLDQRAVSNHRESYCFHIEKLQLYDVNLKAAEPLLVPSVECVQLLTPLSPACPAVCICQA